MVLKLVDKNYGKEENSGEDFLSRILDAIKAENPNKSSGFWKKFHQETQRQIQLNNDHGDFYFTENIVKILVDKVFKIIHEKEEHCKSLNKQIESCADTSSVKKTITKDEAMQMLSWRSEITAMGFKLSQADKVKKLYQKLDKSEIQAKLGLTNS